MVFARACKEAQSGSQRETLISPKSGIQDRAPPARRTLMLAHAVRRIAAAVPVMLLVALMVFSLLYLAPGDPAAIIAGDQATPAEIEHIRISLGLDRPFLVRFIEWLAHLARGDLGTSIFTNLPVTLMIGQRVEPTLVLLVMTLTFSVGIAVPLGTIAAWKQGTWIDQLLMVGAVLGFSIPVFIVGYLLAYIFALKLSWLPVQGYTPLAEGVWACMRSVVLPAISLGTVYAALIARVTRAAMLEVLSQDYVRTAKAKGVGQPTILSSFPEERGHSNHDSHRNWCRAAHRRFCRDRKCLRNSRHRASCCRCHFAS